MCTCSKPGPREDVNQLNLQLQRRYLYLNSIGRMSILPCYCLQRVKIQPKLSPTKPQENEDPAYQRGEGEGGRIEEKMDTAAPGNKDNDLMTILR